MMRMHPSLEAYRAELEMLAAVDGGARTLRLAGERYLPRFPLEAPEVWRTRLSQAVTLGVVPATLDRLAAMAVGEGVQLDAPPAIVAWWDDVDGLGTHGDVFTQRVIRAALRDGLAYVLVDAPREGGMPYVTLRERMSVIDWQHEWDNGRMVMTRCVIAESPEMVREYRRQDDGVSVVSWARREAWGEWREVDRVVMPWDGIPLVPVYSTPPVMPHVAPSPVAAIAYREVEWYQAYSDFKHNLHLACVALLVGRNLPDTDVIRVAPTSVACLSGDQSLEYVEVRGAGLAAAAAACESVKRDIEALGLPFSTGPAKTATEASYQHSLRMALVRSVASSMRDVIDQVVWRVASWMGIPLQPARMAEIRTDMRHTYSDRALEILSEARRRGDVDLLTYLRALRSSGILADATPEEVITRIATEYPDATEEA